MPGTSDSHMQGQPRDCSMAMAVAWTDVSCQHSRDAALEPRPAFIHTIFLEHYGTQSRYKRLQPRTESVVAMLRAL